MQLVLPPKLVVVAFLALTGVWGVAAPDPLPANASSAVLWAEDALTKVLRSATAGTQAAGTLNLSGARREVLSGQAVFRPQRSVTMAQARITHLKHRSSNAVLGSDTIRLQWVRYIDITRNSDIPRDEQVVHAPGSVPDPYWEEPAIPIQADQAQPLWIEVRVPENAPAGDYDGLLTVTAQGSSFTLPVCVHVWDFALPLKQRLSVVNWWQFPGPGFESHGAEDWDLLRRFAVFLVEHRQTDLQTDFSRIRESVNAPPGETYDTSRLERYAEVAFDAGIRQIHLHSVGRRTADILDPQARVEPNEANLRRLAAWEKVIQRRGWQRRFVTSIVDEPFVC